MFLRWIRNWLLIDVLAFGAGAASLVLYVLYASLIPEAYASYKDIWSNLGVEILGVWISVRIIDGLIRAREERNRFRSNVLGNLNYMAGLCLRLSPHFDLWRTNDIGNELKWFNEKRTARAGAKKLAKFFTAEERAEIDGVLTRVAAVKSLADALHLVRARFRRIEDSDFRYHSPKDIQELFKITLRLDRGESEDDTEVRQQLAEVVKKSTTGHYAAEMATKTKQLPDFDQGMTNLIESVTQIVSLRAQSREAIAASDREVTKLRLQIVDKDSP